jgi:hypothetical protein
LRRLRLDPGEKEDPMARRRLAAAAACGAVALGCAQAAPTTPDQLRQPDGAAAGADHRQVTAVLPPLAPPPPAGVKPFLWGSATGTLTPGGTKFLSISIVAGQNALPTTSKGLTGSVYMALGNSAIADSFISLFGTITGGTIVHNPNGGGTANLTGICSEGSPFTIQITDNDDPQLPDLLKVNAPGLFNVNTNVDIGDLRIERALPLGQGAVGQKGVVFDNQIGLFIAQQDADSDELPLQLVDYPEFATHITPPIPQGPAPDAPPDDTTNQDELHLLRQVKLPKL